MSGKKTHYRVKGEKEKVTICDVKQNWEPSGVKKRTGEGGKG